MINKIHLGGGAFTRTGRQAIATLLLIVALAPLRTVAQTTSPDEIFNQLSRIPLHSDVELVLHNTTRVRGELLSYDRKEATIAGHPAPIPLADIKTIKRLRGRSGWNPLWGISGSWKIAVIGSAIVLVLGIIAAKSTR